MVKLNYSVQDFCTIMEDLAPLELALEWDNVGLQLGDPNKKVSTVLVTLTVTDEVAKRAAAEGVDLVIAHHPVIFKPVKTIRTDQPQGALLATLLRHEIAVYVAHTNLDQAAQGLNFWLARDLGLKNQRVLVQGDGENVGLGRVGSIPAVTLGELAQHLETLWGTPVRMVGEKGQTISTVAVVGGSGGDFISHAKAAGAHVLVTGDVSYHEALDAEALGLTILDAGHFSTEKIVAEELKKYLQVHFTGDVTILEDTSTNPFRF